MVDYPQDVRYKGSPCTYMGYVFLYMMQRSLLMSLSSLPITFVDAIYPVGAIFQTTSDVNPNDYFGVGVWEKIENAFLYGGGTKIAKSMGGEETHTLTLSEMPSHSHSGSTNSAGSHTHTLHRPIGDKDYCNGNSPATWWGANKNGSETTSSSGNHSHNLSLNNTGGNAAHNNMPPYYVMHIWHRVS